MKKYTGINTGHDRPGTEDDTLFDHGPIGWPDNNFTRILRTWPETFADEPDIDCPSQLVLDRAATLSHAVTSDFRMVTDADGGIVFESPHGKYHIWNDGTVEWIGMQGGKVVERIEILMILS